jgi:type IV pilus assembly protein PilX
MRNHRRLRCDSPRRQHGVVLFISLIVLVALALATVAILRSVNAGLLIAGNLSFKRSATVAADFGLEQARGWISSPPASVDFTVDGAGGVARGAGYYASYAQFANLTTSAWTDANSVEVTGTPVSDYKIRYVIHRLCQGAGVVEASTCILGAGNTSSSMTSTHYGTPSFANVGNVYYRITARIQGPKNTVSYVQASLY